MKHPEQILQSQCVEWFKFQYRRRKDVMLFNIPNGSHIGGKRVINKITGKSYPVGAGIAQSMGLTKGVADLCLLANGKTYFIEMKAAKGKQSPEQKEFQKFCDLAGIFYRVIDNFEDFKSQIKVILPL